MGALVLNRVQKVVNLPPDKNIPEDKPSSQNNRKWAWLGCVIGASIVFRGPSFGPDSGFKSSILERLTGSCRYINKSEC